MGSDPPGPGPSPGPWAPGRAAAPCMCRARRAGSARMRAARKARLRRYMPCDKESSIPGGLYKAPFLFGLWNEKVSVSCEM